MLSRREEAPIVLEDERYTNGFYNDFSRNILNVSEIYTAEINVLTAGIITPKKSTGLDIMPHNIHLDSN